MSGCPIGAAAGEAARAIKLLQADAQQLDYRGEHTSAAFTAKFGSSPAVQAATHDDGFNRSGVVVADKAFTRLTAIASCGYGSGVECTAFESDGDIFVDVNALTCSGHAVRYSVRIEQNGVVTPFGVVPDDGPSQACWGDGDYPNMSEREARTRASIARAFEWALAPAASPA